MLKKIISKILNGNIEVKSFIDISDQNNKFYNIKLESSKKDYTSIYILNNARIIKCGNTCLAVLKKNFLIKELCFQSRDLIRKDISSNKILKTGYLPFFPKTIKGTSVCLLQDISQEKNYFHFLYDSIVKLQAIEKLEEINYDNILIPSKKLDFQKQIVQALNLKKKIIDCDKFEIIDLEKLIMIDHPYWQENNSWFKDISNIPEWSIKFLREKFLSLDSEKQFKKKIFIDRSDSTSPYNQIENNYEVINFLKSKGFEILQFTSLTFNEQIKAFKNADLIVGGHGSAFANLAFCKPNTKLVELRQKDHPVSLDKISRINSFSHNIWLIEVNKNGKMFVNIKKLENYII